MIIRMSKITSSASKIKNEEMFPFYIDLLDDRYSVDYISENKNMIKMSIGLYNNVVIHFRFRKEYDSWYVNQTFLRNIVCRNLETYLFKKEMGVTKSLSDDDEWKMVIFNKYWRKGVVVPKDEDILEDEYSECDE